MSWKRRQEPYTAVGILRLKCIRCPRPAAFQWQVCADGNNYRPICSTCDVELNARVLTWMKDPKAKEKVEAYAKRVLNRTPAYRNLVESFIRSFWKDFP